MSEDSVGMANEASKVLVILSMASVKLVSISDKVAEVDRMDFVGAIEESVRAAVALNPIVTTSVGSPLKISEPLVVN
jgi:hypothetical protein